MRLKRYSLLLLAVLPAGLASCKGININLETPEPIEVNIRT